MACLSLPYLASVSTVSLRDMAEDDLELSSFFALTLLNLTFNCTPLSTNWNYNREQKSFINHPLAQSRAGVISQREHASPARRPK